MSWVKLNTEQQQVPRSSHSLSVVGDKAYIFGGEIKPRQPVDNHLYVYDLLNEQWNVIEDDNAPPPRVGACVATIDEKIYIFGGRGGKEELTVLPSDLYEFDTVNNRWSKISVDEGPERRSYHCMTASKTHLFLFGGCGASGRLNDFFSFEISTRKWKRLTGPNISPRGGAGIAYTLNNKIGLFGGYDGAHELNDFHVYDVLNDEWHESGVITPPKRSVHGMCAIDNTIVILYGERDPSSLGHDGAGKFLNDVWTYNYESNKWIEIKSDTKPLARGWFQVSQWGGKVVLSGGLDENNQRLDDLHVLKLD
jgi:N-acetylneuraminic acid mutarotase